MIDQDKMRALAASLRVGHKMQDGTEYFSAYKLEAADAIDLLLAEVEAAKEQSKMWQALAEDSQKLAESAQRRADKLRAELEAAAADKRELSALLPGPYYMDPPDGGDVSLIEQLRRMAKDAERYRLLHGCHDDFDILHWRNAGWKSTSGRELDEAIDAARTGGAQ